VYDGTTYRGGLAALSGSTSSSAYGGARAGNRGENGGSSSLRSRNPPSLQINGWGEASKPVIYLLPTYHKIWPM